MVGQRECLHTNDAILGEEGDRETRKNKVLRDPAQGFHEDVRAHL